MFAWQQKPEKFFVCKEIFFIWSATETNFIHIFLILLLRLKFTELGPSRLGTIPSGVHQVKNYWKMGSNPALVMEPILPNFGLFSYSDSHI